MRATISRGKGYRIVERNYRCRGGEIDIIAEQHTAGALRRLAGARRGLPSVRGDQACALGRDFGEPREAVDGARQREKLRLAALSWLGEHGSGLQPRFDVIEVQAGRRRAGIQSHRKCF